MKKYLSIYTLLALACIVLQSCLFSEEEIFDESSANRATADVIKCQEILKDVPNGWKLEYRKQLFCRCSHFTNEI